MPSEVILPRVDMDMATGKISKWLVAPGATVAKGQPLFEIETDKATMEIEAEAAGTIRDLKEAGSTDIPVGSVVAWIDAAGDMPGKSAPTTPAAAEPEDKASAAAVAGVPPDAVARQEPAAAPVPAGDRARATPLARRLARGAKLDLNALRGSGPRGRVQAADVAASLKSSNGAEPAPIPVLPPSPEQAIARTADGASASRTGPAPQPSQTAGGDLKKLRGGSGTPLLLVHGFGGDTNGWRPFLQGQSLGRPVLGLDLPGHGDAAMAAIASFDDLVDSVEASLSASAEHLDVAAHSLGAAVMTAVAARGTVPIRSLLLLAPAGLGPDINGGFLRGFLDASSEPSLTAWMRELVADPQIITPAFVRATLKAREGSDHVAQQRRLVETVFPDGTQSFSVRADLAKLRLPTRIVFGTADAIIPVRHARGLPPLVALHLLPGIGHMPYLEARETVAAIMAQMGAT